MTFYEQRLDLGINYGATFGPRFNTAVLTQSDGQEQRRALWSQPLILAQLGDRRVTQSELNTLLAFHATVKGAAIGFRLRDWSDYKATNQPVGTGNGTVQTWQLVKTYAISTATVKRPITKPVAGSVVVYVDGVEEENGWSVDTTTGVLTTELTGAIAVDFEFDVPVRFEQDKIDFTFEAKGLFTLAPLTCTEIRVEPTIYPALDTLPGSLEEIIDLGYDFGTLGGPSFSTGIKANGAEFELRKSRWESSLGSWDIGDRLLIRSELDYLIRLFRVCRGMAIPFRFKDWQTNTVQDVRFAEDRISFRFEAYSEAEVIFNLGGMAVTAITAVTAFYQETLPSPSSWFPASGINGSSTIQFTLSQLSNGQNPQEILDNGGNIFLYLLKISSGDGVSDSIEFTINGQQAINTTNGEWTGDVLANDGTTQVVTIGVATSELVLTPVVFFYWRVEVFY